MTALKWTFARNDGGRESGFHDAGVETFKGNIHRYLARELIQNSLDARRDPNKPVKVEFDLLKIDRGDIPDINTLKVAYTRCAEYWVSDKKAQNFFQTAEKITRAQTITSLRISDYNTTGVLGSDSDRSKNWYNLIRCAGSSSKGGGEGGSFGIGKNAPFAASRMRAVLYSTYNAEKEHIFQGVTTLVSHNNPSGGTLQPTGFLGDSSGGSAREKKDVPPKFLRTSYGTDITILGFPEDDTWQNDLVYSVLENFWPAIHFEELEVKVGTATITKSNLVKLLESFGSQEDFSANYYYRAFTNPTHTFPGDLARLKKVGLYFFVGDSDLPKRVAMVRKTGMVIFPKQFRSMMPFCGVFICRNDEGNKLLREMEPPRHDTWDPDHPEKGANKKVELEYVNFIRDCIHQLAPVDDSKVISLPGLNRFLPDDDDTPEEEFDGGEEAGTKETPERRPLSDKIQGHKIDVRKRPTQPDQTVPKDGQDETEDLAGEGTGGGAGGNGNGSGGNGLGGGGGGKGAGSSQPAAGSFGGINSKPPIPIRYRTFCRDAAAGVYILTVAAEKAGGKDANIIVWSVGDDQKAPAEITSARTVEGKDIAVRSGGVIGPLKIPKGQLMKLEVVLTGAPRFAMEVSAHEA